MRARACAREIRSLLRPDPKIATPGPLPGQPGALSLQKQPLVGPAPPGAPRRALQLESVRQSLQYPPTVVLQVDLAGHRLP